MMYFPSSYQTYLLALILLCITYYTAAYTNIDVHRLKAIKRSHTLPSKAIQTAEMELEQEEEEDEDPIAFLASLGNLSPLDTCFLGCRMCFVKESILMNCVNKACLTDVLMGQKISNPMWAKMCPGLAYL